MRAFRWCRRLWPDSLFARLSLILVIGGLSIQLLSSSIWYDVRYSQVLEAPARLVMFRTVEVIQRLNENPSFPLPTSETFHVEQRSSPLPMTPHLNDAQENVERLLQDALHREVGDALQLSLLDVEIHDENGQPGTWSSLFGLSRVIGHFNFQLRLASGQWLHIQAIQARGWNGRPAWQVLGDYALRVYLLRALALIAVALVVVRLSTRPLRRLVRAASSLGHDIRQPPLPIEGPREMRQAAETFNVMQQQLIDLMGERTQLLSAVSHDLRTPLTRMRLRVESISEASLREKLIANIDQMETLIAALLDPASQGAAPEGHAAFDLAGLINEVVDEFAETGSDVRWNGAPATMVTGHAPSLRRVLHNLIDNALRYAGNARLALRRIDDRVEVEIQDDGPGIDEAHLTHIVQPYVRGETSDAAGTIGYGLGLGITRSIVMAHQGRLSLTNRAGGGLRVVIALPTHRP
ncbi:ATP-binding protein [Kushneria indalinina]|uniref:histidine kinase n=1 Tax=Kushneria indalinina DSM 14324 TaxID=1122140 RepID=A0A3D9DXS8_9GAMM|nr:ATP-binding protein [Kushneria indalinina]REC95576.1 signal transduction histidine kinase [Kushneria indalinina DSM 14324]